MLNKLLAELKRRRVIRAMGVYTVAAWGVFQVVHTLFETLGLPKWTSTLALALLALGLPVVVVVSWIFDRRPDGSLEVTTDAPPGGARVRLGRGDMLLLAGVVLVVGLAGAQLGGLLRGGQATILGLGEPDRSVAVLPFVVFSAEKDSDYFADGLTEEVINSLAQVPDLKVAGRTSAFYFKGKNEDLREVGKRLGVAHVVEGSVRREGDRLRVTAQLVSVRDGFHLWSRSYDRTLNDAFAIQSEIGEQVAEALKTKLKVKTRPVTRDPGAYQLQLTSRAHLRRLGLEDLKAAQAGFAKLMELEPQNAAGYAGYAQATIMIAQNYLAVDFSQAQRVSEVAIDKALKLDPSSADAWMAQAMLRRVQSLRIGGARYDEDHERALRRTLELDPRNPEALTMLAVRLSDTGRAAEAEATGRKAVEVDPLSRLALLALGRAQAGIGKLDEAGRQFKALIELYPDFVEGKFQLASLLVEQGRLDEAEPLFRDIGSGGDDPYLAFQAAWVLINLGLPEEADKLTAAIKTSPGKELAHAASLAQHGDWAGMLAFGKALQAKDKDPFWPMVVFQGSVMLGRDEEAIAAIKSIRPDLFGPDASATNADFGSLIVLAHALRRTGNQAQADRLLDSVLRLTAPRPGERPRNEWRISRAKVYAERGQTRQAIDEIEAAVKAGWRTPYLFDDSVWLPDYPSFAAIRNEPRFKALMTQVREDLARQKAALLAARR